MKIKNALNSMGGGRGAHLAGALEVAGVPWNWRRALAGWRSMTTCSMTRTVWLVRITPRRVPPGRRASGVWG